MTSSSKKALNRIRDLHRADPRENRRKREEHCRKLQKKKLLKKTMVSPLVIISLGKGRLKGTERKRSRGKR